MNLNPDQFSKRKRISSATTAGGMACLIGLAAMGIIMSASAKDLTPIHTAFVKLVVTIFSSGTWKSDDTAQSQIFPNAVPPTLGAIWDDSINGSSMEDVPLEYKEIATPTDSGAGSVNLDIQEAAGYTVVAKKTNVVSTLASGVFNASYRAVGATCDVGTDKNPIFYADDSPGIGKSWATTLISGGWTSITLSETLHEVPHYKDSIAGDQIAGATNSITISITVSTNAAGIPVWSTP